MATPRAWTFGALCVIAVAIAAAYAMLALRLAPQRAASAPLLARLAAAPPPPFLMVRSTAPDDTFRRLMLVPLDTPNGAGFPAPLECERSYFAANRGICLVEESDGLTVRHYADVFDEQFMRLHRFPLTGLPSRTRVSPDGRFAAVTVFETGHSYAQEGFSTRTTIIDTVAGRSLGDLEQFTARRQGKSFHAADFNYWGVTFARDSNRFYATLATGATNYLVEGRVDRRDVQVVRDGVECPSLSPDNTRIAYKHMIEGGGMWQLRVYDLRTRSDVALTMETRSVDDQVDWLDNDRVMYHITGARGADIWVMRSDNTEAPAILREYAYSPAVVR